MAKQFKKIAPAPKLPLVSNAVAKMTLDSELPAPVRRTVSTPTVDTLLGTKGGTVTVPATVAGKHRPKLTREFLFAGRALFTVNNGKGEHYTYRVRSKDSRFTPGQKVHFLSVKALGGMYPHRFIGILNLDGSIKTTAKSEFTPGTREFDVAQWATKSVCDHKLIPESYEIQHAGHCGRCGRTLTDPQSIERGIGPECWSIMGH